MEVNIDTKFDDSIWIRVPGERKAILFFLRNMYTPPESNSTVEETKRYFGEIITVHVQTCRRQGVILLLYRGDFNSTNGKASNPN